MWALKISNFLLKLSCDDKATGPRSPDFLNLNVISRPPVALCPNSEIYIYIYYIYIFFYIVNANFHYKPTIFTPWNI